ncbi:MAG TPA: NADPH-dependent 7-cyano-7-deazaguanine reductase QueF [bacterium]|nr:NADPH-dependent 7-cyano-7-deazaguanine reductase QueF [bacterium]
MPKSKPKPGQEAIARARLEVVENRYPHRDYEIDISLPEFTCLCPISGYPDFAVIHVKYRPDRTIIELKSLKLYINQFRDREVFHEEAVNCILEDLAAACKPRWIRVTGDFNPRGNVKTVVTAEHGEPAR